MITSGPTRGYIDAVRYVGNKSTGKLGAAIAAEALGRGAWVTFVYGTGSVLPDVASSGKEYSRMLELIEVETIDDVLTTIRDRLREKSFDAIVHAMAVLDYTPERQSDKKISSDKDKLTITLVKTPKVIHRMRELWPQAFFASFKLEAGLSTDALIERAYESLTKNRVNLVVANDQNEITEEKHRAYLIDSRKEIVARCETKQEISKNLIDILARHNRSQTKSFK